MPALIPGENECAKYLFGAKFTKRLDLNREHLEISAKLIAWISQEE
jgi:hypothetical protein